MSYIENQVKIYPKIMLFPELYDKTVCKEKIKLVKRLYPKVILVNKFPIKWGLAINLFNKVYAKRKLTNIQLQHETIHSLQMKELGYIKFYLFYIYEWIKLSFKYKNIFKGYLNISFEKEAYKYESNIEYIVDKYEYITKKSLNK